MHLPAARLLGREHDLVTEPFEHRDRRASGLGRKRVREAGREERDTHAQAYAAGYRACMSEAILVVDDDAPIRRMLERTLTAEGYRVATAVDGGAALATIEQSVPDLVVLDVGMPGVDGLAVCRRARARGLATPILLLTARDSLSDRVGGLDAGADDYLVKPFETEELLARVLALLLLNQRQVVTRETALARVWGSAHAASSNSVDRYVSYLRRKLGEPSLIETVRGTGFVLGR